jgi:hypothetical protein
MVPMPFLSLVLEGSTDSSVAEPNSLARCVSRRRVSFAATHTATAPFIFAPIVRAHPAALTVRVHELPRPVRVCSQGGWVRNGIKVDWIYGKYMTICLTSMRCYKRGLIKCSCG